VTIQEAAFTLKKKLQEIYEPRESANISDWVMEDITGMHRIDRIIQQQALLSAEQFEIFTLYSSRLLNGMPVQYVTGYAWFMGSRFCVNENVLIPRPETEELVHWALEDPLVKGKSSSPLIVLDIGTGSGCIPVMMKKKLPTAEVHSMEISDGALDIARKNAGDHLADIHFHTGNFLDPGTWDDLPDTDLLISNPPYIPLRDKDTIARNVVNFEPHLAIFVSDSDPLIFYRAITGFAEKKLKNNGSIFVELDEEQGRALKKLMEKSGFRVEEKKDMQGRFRMMKLVR
jgi:release factor glutamine methyltransferase